MENIDLTAIERIKNNLLMVLMFIGSVIIFIREVLDDVDFSTWDGVYVSIPVLLGGLARLQTFGPITMQKMRERREI